MLSLFGNQNAAADSGLIEFFRDDLDDGKDLAVVADYCQQSSGLAGNDSGDFTLAVTVIESGARTRTAFLKSNNRCRIS